MFTETRKLNSLSSVSSQANVRQPMQCSARDLNQLLQVGDIGSNVPVLFHRTVKEGKHLIRAGEDFNSLYVVNAGFFKTVFTDDAGNEQVMGFPIKGDMLGTDGIGDHRHLNDVVALSDADVIVVPFKDLSALARLVPGLDETLFRIISQQLIQEQLALTAIGALCAEARLARFLVKLGDQMHQQGYSADKFMLRMSRQDIGSYLGMKIETVSRTLTLLSKKSIVDVDQRDITIINRAELVEIGRGDSVNVDQVINAQGRRHERAADKGRSSLRSRKEPIPERHAATPWSGLTDPITKVSRVAA